MFENILNLGEGNNQSFTESDAIQQAQMVVRATDPNILPQPYATPADFAAQYPQPLNTQEIIAACEEVTMFQAIPEVRTSLQSELWRELNSLAFTSGSASISFADGECPEEYTHDGTNTTIALKNIGAKKTLSESDIMHSQAVAGMNVGGYGVGIAELIGGVPSGEGAPGGTDMATFQRMNIANVYEKEVRLSTTLTLNAWDRLLVSGDMVTNALEFDGIEFQVTTANGSHNNDTTAASGTFSSSTYDRFLAESCAKPTHIAGHTAAIQELLSGYFQLGFQGSQLVNFEGGDRITPGFNFAGFVNTGIGRLAVISDFNFTRNAIGNTFSSNLYGLRMNHNGVPLVAKFTQIPFQVKDLVPGCTAISFMVWAKTALVVKHRCAHSKFSAIFTGNVTTTCPRIG